MLALGLGLGLGLAVKLYYFTPTRVIASVNLLGHNSDTFTAAEQVKFRTGISTLLSVELGKVAVSSVSDLTSARRRRVFLRKLLSSTSSTASARIKVGFTVEVKNRASVDDMEDLITLQTATQITSALQAAGMTGISSSAATVESQISESIKNVTTLDDLIGGGDISSLIRGKKSSPSIRKENTQSPQPVEQETIDEEPVGGEEPATSEKQELQRFPDYPGWLWDPSGEEWVADPEFDHGDQ